MHRLKRHKICAEVVPAAGSKRAAEWKLDVQVDEAQVTSIAVQTEPQQDHTTAGERGEDKVVELRRQLAAAKLLEGDQVPEVSDLKRRVVDLHADLDGKVCMCVEMGKQNGFSDPCIMQPLINITCDGSCPLEAVHRLPD